MSSALTITRSDRLLILAPHPDDESIATGGLIQIARAAGASVQVTVLTDGDNNPWPQRWIEKRWRIDAAARARWGARRREEARSAMRVLGLDDNASTFLGLPDMGLTDLLMRNDPQATQKLRGVIERFEPTILVLPAASDRHPDHSAAHVFARFILAQMASPAPRLYSFAVHGRASGPADVIVLSAAQCEHKQRAILTHETQMRLSRRRFLAYAQTDECFRPEPGIATADAEHPLRAHFREGSLLRVTLDLAQGKGAWRGKTLFVALEDGGRVLKRLGGDEERSGDVLCMDIVCPSRARGYVKLALRDPGWRVFDRCGWQSIAQT